MEEILELKEKLYQGDIQAAIAICSEEEIVESLNERLFC